MNHVIYLTGAPASGKSTLGRALKQRVSNLVVHHYSTLLSEHIERRSMTPTSEDDLRRSSSKIITHDDIIAVDQALVRHVSAQRLEAPILIDSHPVTKEEYGYRITPFAKARLHSLSPTIVCVLYAEAAEITRRITADSGGRPLVNHFQADFHVFLQAQVAFTYSWELGIPIYLLDSTQGIDRAVDKIIKILQSP